VANLSQGASPLDLHFCAARLFKTPRQPKVTPNMTQEVGDAHARGCYVLMGVQGDWRENYTRIVHWDGLPIVVYRYGGRGSTQYAGPQIVGRQTVFCDCLEWHIGGRGKYAD